MKSNSVEALWYEITIKCIKVCLLALPFLFYFQEFSAIIGLILGTGAAVAKLYFLMASVKSASEMSSGQASTYTYSRYIIRQAFAGVVLIGAIFIDFINFYWVVIGLILPKFVILGGRVLTSLQESYGKFSRKLAKKGD
ncbi:MAG: hypothetical protein D5R97_03985 [Candidatus Syntrophonatronum acetioxidans]|uniref:ATP synthase subunit I n=1 Tax=Candidatus Syntrophonatronum acetioxidans TaxID=1795816 RepID=A0A424YFV3_9FIRM|nr:MAG: hypothetical protein D5R97_03985 [Candidatus Syntrophonatronum acetioxidans]